MTIPIIKLGPNLIVTIQEEISDKSAMELQQKILCRIREWETSGLLIDLSVIDVVDSFLGRVLNDTARMAQLMGVKTVISGIQPGVAITFMELGLKLDDIHTVLGIEQGIAYLKAQESDGE
jgi:rsbT antagonist protein RsbS